MANEDILKLLKDITNKAEIVLTRIESIPPSGKVIASLAHLDALLNQANDIFKGVDE